ARRRARDPGLGRGAGRRRHQDRGRVPRPGPDAGRAVRRAAGDADRPEGALRRDRLGPRRPGHRQQRLVQHAARDALR
ncbi:hypothetical protein LTR94_037804, partial [Friedmanniomyces endolithicus]